VGFNITNQLLNRFFAFVRYWRKKWDYHLSTDFKKAYVSVRRDVLYKIVTEFGVPMTLVRLIKMCLNETYSKDPMGQPFSMLLPWRNP
jgi:hypothetical protein